MAARDGARQASAGTSQVSKRCSGPEDAPTERQQDAGARKPPQRQAQAMQPNSRRASAQRRPRSRRRRSRPAPRPLGAARRRRRRNCQFREALADLNGQIRTRSDDAVEETWRETAEKLGGGARTGRSASNGDRRARPAAHGAGRRAVGGPRSLSQAGHVRIAPAARPAVRRHLDHLRRATRCCRRPFAATVWTRMSSA